MTGIETQAGLDLGDRVIVDSSAAAHVGLDRAGWAARWQDSVLSSLIPDVMLAGAPA